MQDLEVIERQNARAAEGEIARQVAAGKTVVARYAGLHYLSHQAFDTAEQAAEAKATIDAEGASTHAKLFSPAA